MHFAVYQVTEKTEVSTSFFVKFTRFFPALPDKKFILQDKTPTGDTMGNQHRINVESMPLSIRSCFNIGFL